MALFRSLGARKDATRGTTALEVRKGLALLFSGAGVLPGADSPLVSGTASWAYSIGKGGFVSTRGVSDGVHLFGNDGATTVATGAAPGSGLSRIDIVWVTQPSNSENADTSSVATFGVTQGTAASVPVAPSVPTGALELARNTMTSAATSTVSAGNTLTQTAARATLTAPEYRSFTPSLVGLSLGNGSMGCRLVQHGKKVDATLAFVLGSTSVISGVVYIGLPAPSSASYSDNTVLGEALFFDSSGNLRQPAVAIRSSADFAVLATLTGALADATTPWVWATGDQIRLNLTYEAA